MKILITGGAGFIGMHLARVLANDKSNEIFVIDSLKDANASELPKLRRKVLLESGIQFVESDLSHPESHIPIEFLDNLDSFIHLAAWPGVSTGQSHPSLYYKNNIQAFGKILDLVAVYKPRKFLFASSSSVYGDQAVSGKVSEADATGLNLKSYYASTKWVNEIMAKSHQAITNIPTVALRFFTVFGSYGRPDMAYWKFADKLARNEVIEFWGENGGRRNFTHISTVTDAISLILKAEISGYNPLNIAAGPSISTKEFCDSIARSCGNEGYKFIEKPRPSFDVEVTSANTDKLENLVGKLNVPNLESSTSEFVEWYLKLDNEVNSKKSNISGLF
jgi:UDP-glucuronate 4-epimerase